MELNEILPSPVIVYPELGTWVVVNELGVLGPHKQLLDLFLTDVVTLIHIQDVPGRTM